MIRSSKMFTIFFTICIIVTMNLNVYGISEFLDNQMYATYKQPNMYYYSDTSYWRERNLTNEYFMINLFLQLSDIVLQLLYICR